MKEKKIFLLIGQKGSGKSYIGSIMEAKFGIDFIHVEDWAKKVKKKRSMDDQGYLKQVFETIEDGIRARMNISDTIVFESTGLTDYFDQMISSLKKDFKLVTIGIQASPEICLERVFLRDSTIHIEFSETQVGFINDKVRERNFKTDFIITNQSKSESELIEELKSVLLSF